jgi:methylated-DNA-protein-cysteine methyltransferase-like protein
MREDNAVSNDLYQRIYDVARQIPSGRVATYGQLATIVGAPISARDVGDAMAALRDRHPTPPVPWQRVINAQGKVSTGLRQQQLLEQEGVTFNAKGHTDLQRFGWRGPDPGWAAAHGFAVLKEPAAGTGQLDLF